jgi:hypothetical protein
LDQVVPLGGDAAAEVRGSGRSTGVGLVLHGPSVERHGRVGGVVQLDEVMDVARRASAAAAAAIDLADDEASASGIG